MELIERKQLSLSIPISVFRLLQPHFGYLSCIVSDTQSSRNACNLNQRAVEKIPCFVNWYVDLISDGE